jgi:hypothetical protein
MTKQPNRRPGVIGVVIAAVIALGVVLLVMAFVLAGQTGFEGKTLWDWMGLLTVPLVLGVGVFLLNRSEQRRQAEIAARRAKAESKMAQDRAEVERELAHDRAETERNQALDRTREDRLQTYLDRMQALLEKGLKSPPPDSDLLRDVARTRTLTVLRGLDGEYNGFLLSFLRDSDLLIGASPVISLRMANLSKADLSWADLSRTDLSRANLSWANLSRANLSWANLSRASLSPANLSGANLSGADLSWANLSGALYSDATQWPDGFDPIAAGAKKVDQELPDKASTDASRHA